MVYARVKLKRIQMVRSNFLLKAFAMSPVVCLTILIVSQTSLTFIYHLNLTFLQPSTVFSSQSMCHIFLGTKMEGKSIAVVRLLGPSLPPLQSPQQMSLNLKHLLLHEKTLRGSHNCVKTLWIVGCNYNFTERGEIVSTLAKHKQNFSGIS